MSYSVQANSKESDDFEVASNKSIKVLSKSIRNSIRNSLKNVDEEMKKPLLGVNNESQFKM